MSYTVAKVIVDVPSRETDRPFDYLIPEAMRYWIEVGSRVGVPFGRRTVQGFVISLHSESEMDPKRMKAIQELLDLTPPLPPDLVELAGWMSGKYACSRIAVLQAMIPTALKGRAERRVSVIAEWTGSEAKEIPDESNAGNRQAILSLLSGEEVKILDYVAETGQPTLEQLSKRYPERAAEIKGLIGRGLLTESQVIKDKVRKKR